MRCQMVVATVSVAVTIIAVTETVAVLVVTTASVAVTVTAVTETVAVTVVTRTETVVAAMAVTLAVTSGGDSNGKTTWKVAKASYGWSWSSSSIMSATLANMALGGSRCC